MPTKHRQEKITLTEAERARLASEAERADLSFSNLLRVKLGLEPLTRYAAPKGNTFALNNPGRSKQSK
jgi:hypothetical protein